MSKRKFSSVNPDKLREPGDMSEATTAVVHAMNQVALLTEDVKTLTALRRKWNRRLRRCLNLQAKYGMR